MTNGINVSSKYNVTSAYNLLTTREEPSKNERPSTIRYKKVPLKVNIFA